MSMLGNILFFIFGGFLIFFGYLLGGIVLCLTIVGIPFGIQCFKLAGGVLAPFGREVRETQPPGGTISVLMNVIWILLPGLELAIFHLVLAALFQNRGVAASDGRSGTRCRMRDSRDAHRPERTSVAPRSICECSTTLSQLLDFNSS